jgi:hypothetical protein
MIMRLLPTLASVTHELHDNRGDQNDGSNNRDGKNSFVQTADVPQVRNPSFPTTAIGWCTV